MRPPTLSDVADLAGVSYATADRVVNSRGRVAEKSVRKVNDAVATLGYVRNVAAANLSRGRTYRFVFLLPSGPNAFFRRMRDILSLRQKTLGLEKTEIVLREVPAFEPHALSAELTKLEGEQLDGLAVVGVESEIICRQISRLRDKGVPVVALVSDLPVDVRSAYIGVDNLKAGSTAARLIGMAHGGGSGKVQVVVGSLRARDHLDRLSGFRAVLAQSFPELVELPEIEGLDRSEVVEAKIQSALHHSAGVTAIYSIGAGNSGLKRAIESAAHRPFCVVHELVSHARDGLESGVFDVVIDQCPEQEIDTALGLMRAIIDRKPPPPFPPLLPTIYVRDNLPPPDSNP